MDVGVTPHAENYKKTKKPEALENIIMQSVSDSQNSISHRTHETCHRSCPSFYLRPSHRSLSFVQNQILKILQRTVSLTVAPVEHTQGSEPHRASVNCVSNKVQQAL